MKVPRLQGVDYRCAFPRSEDGANVSVNVNLRMRKG